MREEDRKINVDWSSILEKKCLSHKYIEDSHNNMLPNESFRIKKLLLPTECKKIITKAELLGFNKTDYDQHYRSNLRLIIKDKSLAILLFERIKQYMPPTIKNWKLSGLNECFRLSKYNVGNRFDIHYDTYFKRNNDEQSFFTVNIYLNDEYEGGETRFYDKLKNGNIIASIKGETGESLIFMQPHLEYLPHDGSTVTTGIKYLLRTDVMYTKLLNVKQKIL